MEELDLVGVLTLAAVALLVLIVKKIIPDTPLTGGGCGGG